MLVRPITPSDIPSVSSLLYARRDADRRAPLSEHKALRLFAASEVGLVALEGGRLTGYAHVSHHDARQSEGGHWAAEIAVDPDVPNEQAVAAALIDAIAAAIDLSEEITLWAWRPEEIAAARSRGMHEIRALHEMKRRLPIGEREPLPEGVALRTFVVGRDEEAWLDANNAAFAEHRENGALDIDNLRARMAQPWFDPAGFLLAWEGDALVGSCWTKLHPDGVGEIYIIGVRPEHQGRGLGTSLVEAGLHDLATRQQAGSAILYVDAADVRAVEFYRALGFTADFTTREFAVR